MGQGGFGVVWKASDLRSGRLVAIKTLLSGKNSDSAKLMKKEIENMRFLATIDIPQKDRRYIEMLDTLPKDSGIVLPLLKESLSDTEFITEKSFIR